MPSEWIRPAGCESGSCVEYRTVGDKVFVRNSSDHVGEEMLEFTVAEWDTFVAGLVASAPCSCQSWPPDGPSPDCAVHGAIRALNETMVERDQLAAENARLRRDLAEEKATTKRALDSYEAMGQTAEALMAERDEALRDVASLQAQMTQAASNEATLRLRAGNALTAADNLRAERDEAEGELRTVIAELLVLRHRDRRTQAVVDAAVAWRAMVAQTGERGIRIEGGNLADAVDKLTEAKLCICRPRHREDDPICQYVPGAPETDLSATESPEQPPVEGTATDGLEAQGGAQDATTCRCGAPDSLHEEGDIRIIPAAPTPVTFASERFTATRAGWYEITRYLTAVREGLSGLPDLADVDRHIVHLTDEDLADNDRKPDGEVPEAGRAGEAQDRTEGLDAAIEAAREHQPRTLGGGHWWCYCGEDGAGDFWESHRLVAQLRAASPLIERAALNAAADEIVEAKFETLARLAELEGGTAATDYAKEYAMTMDGAARLVRDRATRTETS